MNKTGMMGDPRKSSKEKGKRIFDTCSEKLLIFVEEF